MSFSGDVLYIVNGDSLYMIDVFDPSNPELAGTALTPGWAESVVVRGNTIFVADTWLFDIFSAEGIYVNISGNMPGLTLGYSLHSNFPNPFNPVTNIGYDLPQTNHVSIIIYDLLGREVRSLVNQNKNPGYHSIQWDGTDDSGKSLSAGLYLYRIQTGEYYTKTNKMVLIK